MPDPPPFYAFDRVAHEYEATRLLPARVAEAFAARIAADVPSAAWILDAGVGTGRLGRALGRRHGRTIGVDIAPGMLARLRAKGPRPFAVLADLRALPFAEGTFDRILAVHVFHLISDWERALSEVWRVLAPGGTLFLGFEDRQRTEVREQYLETAIERGVLPRRLGAHSSQLMEWLAEREARLTTEYPEDLRWEFPITAEETLSQLERRTFSTVWEVPEEEHSRLLADAREWVLRQYGSLKHTETVRVQMLVCAATKR
jgi:ubiquinone/menaquinone biosynthesis C-methylase UbiE